MAEVEDIDSLLELVKNDLGLIDSLSEEQVTALRKRINPYGRAIEGSGRITCLSITNLAEQYQKRLLMTSLVGFLFRACDEYRMSDDEPITHLDDFKLYMERHDRAQADARVALDWLSANEGILDTPQIAAERLTYTKAVERAAAYKERIIIRKFIDSMFQFNPDKHVRSAYADNPLDPERVQPAQTRPDAVEDPRANDHHVRHIPPADVYHKWQKYTDVHYEEIRTAVTDIYADKPDLEFAINPHREFATPEEAEAFVQKHKNETIMDIYTLTNGKWNLIGPFKKNRERINFYSEKTGAIEEILKQVERDKRLGADLMRKKVKAKKKQNVEEAGPEPPEFKQYRENHASAAEALGAEDLSRENKLDEVRDRVNFKVHEECPYDAVQVDVFNVAGGGASITKTQFFTQAEAPDPSTTVGSRRGVMPEVKEP
jgi:hypothetical protein